MSSSSLSLFFEALGILLSSGMTVADCLKLMRDDAEKERDRKHLEELLRELSTAYLLSAAMDKTGLFPVYAINMIRLAERSGSLEASCASLASDYEQETQKSEQLKGAILSPFILVCVMAVVVTFLVNAVLPVFTDIYAQVGVNAASNNITRAALTIGSVTMWVIFAALFCAVAGFLFFKTKPGKRFFTHVAETSFITRRYHEKLSVARFTSAFSTLLSAGEDVPAALSMASVVGRNRKTKTSLDLCYEKVLAGEPLSDILTGSGLFSPSHSGMIRSAARAGRMPVVTQRLSRIYGQDADRMLSHFFSLLKPLLVGAVSVIAGIILLCVMLPLTGILSSVG